MSSEDSLTDLSLGYRSKASKRVVSLREAREQGALDALESFVPRVVAHIEQLQELLPLTADLIRGCVESGNTQGLKESTPLLKLLVDENKRILDRVLGSAVQRSKQEVLQTKVSVSLRDLVELQSAGDRGADELEGRVL